MSKYALGLDFGTESARAVLVNVTTGEMPATAVEPFPDGVIDDTLPGSKAVKLPPDWALQNSSDWLTTLESTVKQVMASSGVTATDIIGIGIDFTACTVLPTTADSTPFHTLPEYKDTPHAWVKLWKHHGAQPQADRVNALADEKEEAWLPRYGGKVSSEWLIPKAMQLLEEAPDIYHSAAHLVEGSDWVVWQLTGQLARNACAAGYKGTWHKADGYPTPKFLAELNPDLAGLYADKVSGPVVAPGSKVGGLTPAWAERLGAGSWNASGCTHHRCPCRRTWRGCYRGRHDVRDYGDLNLPHVNGGAGKAGRRNCRGRGRWHCAGFVRLRSGPVWRG
jgi:L-ribulokinase